MTTRTINTKGLQKPHKGESAKPGIGASMNNARSIATEQGGHKPGVAKGGAANTYFGNSRSINTARGQYGKDK